MRSGFTLLGFLLAISVITTMIGAIMSLSLLSSQVSVREDLVADVEYAGTYAANLITEKVQAADSVSATEHTITLITSGKTTTFTIEDGSLSMEEDGQKFALIPDNLNVLNGQFVLLGETQSQKRGVTMTFGIANAQDYTQTFHATVAGR